MWAYRKLNIAGYYKVFVIYFTFLIALEYNIAYSCPSEVCICKWKNGKQTVECGGQLLTELPQGMDLDTQILNFSGNSLQTLKNERFLRMDLINLQKIYLSRNHLMKIQENSFRGLSNLVEIALSENLLQQVPSDTFQDYTALMRLSLSGNPIRALKTSSFRFLSFLTTLELSNCKIERIEDEAFIGIDNLEWLRLDGNRISYIQGSYILPKALHSVSLQGNRWHCDCMLVDLHSWLVNYNTPHTEEPRCVGPARIKGQIIQTLKKDELACLPEVQPKSTYTEVFEGKNISIPCKVQAIPEAKVLWLFNGQVLPNETIVGDFHMSFYTNEISSEEKRSEVFIYNVGPEYNGTFSCIGQNTAGTTFSNYTLRVIIKELSITNESNFLNYYLSHILSIGAGCGCVLILLFFFIAVKYRRQTDILKSDKKCTQDGSSRSDASLIKSPSFFNENEVIKTTSNCKANHISEGTNSGLLCTTQMYSSSEPMSERNFHGNNAYYKESHTTTPSALRERNSLDNGAMQLHGTANAVVCYQKSNDIGFNFLYSDPTYNQFLLLPAQQDVNPDIISDTEAFPVKTIKSNGNEISDGSSTDSCSLHSFGGINSTSHLDYPISEKQNSQIIKPIQEKQQNENYPRYATMSTLPQNLQIKSLSENEHKADVHLNPVCYLSHDGYITNSNSIHYKQNQTGSSLSQQSNQEQILYRTLPRSRDNNKFYSATLLATPSITRYPMEAEFMENKDSLKNDKFYHSKRPTYESYPIHPAAAIAAIVQYPVSPEDYKSKELNSAQHSTDGPNSGISMYFSNSSFQQWPPFLPGYGGQPVCYPGIQKPAIASAEIFHHQINEASVQKHYPTFSKSSPGLTSSPTQTSLSRGFKSYKELLNKRCFNSHNSELESLSIPECDEEHDAPAEALKLRSLIGPLADSPDEGYVDDSQEGSEI